MRGVGGLLPRRASGLVLEALADTRVVVINGARQTGKSTLAELVLGEAPTTTTRFLDDPSTRVAAHEDPTSFIRHAGTMLIDEVQRVPDLWLAIKRAVDADPRPGQFLLTGSARLLGLSSLPDALPGRAETIELWPLSQGEIDGEPDGFIDALFASGAEIVVRPGELHRSDYVARARRGGYPEAVRREQPRRRARFFENYISDLLVRDIRQVAAIEKANDMRRLLSLLAAQNGSLLNYSRLASELGISAPTVKTYVEIIETIYLIRLIPAWSSNLTTRAVAAPKVVFADSGIAGFLGADSSADQALGGLLEGFVLAELARQLTWSETRARMYHYRDRDQREVDAVLEDNGGRVVGIEVKASETVRSDDFTAMRMLRDRLGDRFHAGVVLYCGAHALRFGDRLACLPVSSLWTTPSP